MIRDFAYVDRRFDMCFCFFWPPRECLQWHTPDGLSVIDDLESRQAVTAMQHPTPYGRPKVKRSFFVRGLARQLFVEHGGVISKRSQDGGGLFEVVGLDAIKDIRI